MVRILTWQFWQISGAKYVLELEWETSGALQFRSVHRNVFYFWKFQKVTMMKIQESFCGSMQRRGREIVKCAHAFYIIREDLNRERAFIFLPDPFGLPVSHKEYLQC